MDDGMGVSHLICDTCDRRFEPAEVSLTCPDCGPDRGTLTVHYPYEEIARTFTPDLLRARRDNSHWRYREILPVAGRPAVLHPRVGWTPLYAMPVLADSFGVERLWIKDDGLNPSASFKDRASSVGVARALAQGCKTITAASTGNAASSLSLFAACAGMRAVIFVPESAPAAKLAQLLIFGAEVLMVRGSYDQAFDLCLATAQERGWYCRNTAVNPYLGEGKKTAALEICEQLDFSVPDAVVVAVGDGCIIGGLAKGFADLVRLGFVDRVPRLYGVQAQGASPLVAAFDKGEQVAGHWPRATTCADSICVGRPRDHIKALRAVRETGGAMVAVEDEAIRAAMRRLARQAGVFAEPAGATGFAGLDHLKSRQLLTKNDKVVVLVTGNGLKDVTTARQAVSAQPHLVDANLAAVGRLLDSRERS